MITLGILMAFLGLCFGSFINALVWRLHEQMLGRKNSLSVFSGRSICPNCRRQLATRDLIPIVSWLALRGRCRWCGQPISIQYPIVEIVSAVVFVISYLLWPLSLATTGQKVLFISWLASAVGLLALAVYDFKWLILPNRILYPTLAAALGGRLVYILGFAHYGVAHKLWMLLLSIVLASGIFLLIYLASGGRWIGYGDVRLGLILGSLLADPFKSLLMIYAASVLGTLYTLPSLVRGQRPLGAKLPFGPFLIVATWLVILFGQNVIDWYSHLSG